MSERGKGSGERLVKGSRKGYQRGAPLAESDVNMKQVVAVMIPAASTLEAPIEPEHTSSKYI